MIDVLAETLGASGLIGSSIYFSPWLWRQYRMRSIRQKLVRERLLALTYDDGPSQSVTPAILDVLRRYGAVATFFALGRQAQLHSDLLDRIVAEGHDVGCHSDQHVHAWKSWPWAAIADMEIGCAHLEPWIKTKPMFRPPFGKLTMPTLLALHRRGCSVWWWTIDSGDTHEELPDPNQIADSLRREGGGIVLLHDHDLDRPAKRKDYVLEVTKTLLQTAECESITTIPLRRLCQ